MPKPLEVLPEETLEKLLQAVVVFDKSLRDYRDWEKKPVLKLRPPVAAHSPLAWECAGYCGEALESMAYFLKVQGFKVADPGDVGFFQLTGDGGLFGPTSFRHVVLVLYTKDIAGKNCG